MNKIDYTFLGLGLLCLIMQVFFFVQFNVYAEGYVDNGNYGMEVFGYVIYIVVTICLTAALFVIYLIIKWINSSIKESVSKRILAILFLLALIPFFGLAILMNT